MPAISRDLRLAARSLRNSPALTAVALFALTLGIGLTTTVFSIVYAATMRGLPYPGADRITYVQRTSPTRGSQRMPMPIHDFVDYRARQRSFESLAAAYAGTANVSGTERAERYVGAWVTANAFAVYGVAPVLGRGIREGEDRPGGERVAVIDHRTWRDRFGGASSAIGARIRVNGLPYTVVGVMPEGFGLPNRAQIWLPLQLDPLALKRGEGQQLTVLGRLRPGVTLDAASADVAGIARRLAVEQKATNEGIEAIAVDFMEGELGPQPRQLLLTMLGAVFLVLLIACTNVANLLLDRAAHRTKEVGIRSALGASRRAVVRQFLAEALVIAGVAALLGVAVAYGGVAAFNRAIVDTEPPAWLDIRLHPPVLLFTIGLGLVATIASGVLPALQASRPDLQGVLKDEARGSTSLRIGRLSKVLVVFEIALSCGLLVAAGLMIKSVTKIRTMDPGYDPRNMFTARVGFPAAYTDTAMQRRFFERLEPALAALPGVRAASLSSGLPGASGGNDQIAVEGATYANDRDYPSSGTLTVTPGFFSTFGLRPVRGRALEASDRDGALRVTVVSQRFADRFFKGTDAIGRRVRIGGPRSTAPWLTIVGVVPDVYSGNPSEPRDEQLYVPLAQNHTNFMSLAVRTAGPPAAMAPAVRGVVAAIDPDIPIYWPYTMEEALARPFWFVRVFGTMFMIFGFIALFLASVGLYAVMAFSVGRRTREVGIRMALGAEPGAVVRMVFGQGLAQLAVGMTAGLALALGVSRVMSILLFDVQPRDPVVFGGVAAVLVLAGLMACLLPARRATRVDPLVALRTD
jgi:putative ABC transport system permease protein